MKAVITLSLIYLFSIVTFGQNTGIGLEVPLGKLHIKANSDGNLPQLRLTESEDDYARIKLESQNFSGAYWDIAARPNSTTSLARLNFYFKNATNSGDRMTILGDGRVGIGLFNPVARLDVNGKIRIGNSTDSEDAGEIRWNSTDNIFEGYNGTEWIKFGYSKQRNVTISMIEFMNNNSTGDAMIINYNSPRGAYIDDGGVYTSSNFLFAPLQLTAGTTIDSIVIFYYDNDINRDLKFINSAFSSLGIINGNSVQTSSNSTSQRKITLITSSNSNIEESRGQFLNISATTPAGAVSSWGSGDLRVERLTVYYKE